MKTRWFTITVLFVVLALVLGGSVALGQAQEVEPEGGKDAESEALSVGVEWQQRLGQDGQDNYRVQRRPGTSLPWQTLLTLDQYGNLTLKGNRLNLGGNNSTRLQKSTLLILDVYVSDRRVLRLESNATSPNVIAGHSSNSVTSGVVGATIGGGGASWSTNRVTDDYGTVSGGYNNRAGDDARTTTDAPYATIGGGRYNIARGADATVSGGWGNTAASFAAVGGGYYNTASGNSAAIAGGYWNTASATDSFIGGGERNTATGDKAVVGGGFYNTATSWATVGGGYSNAATGSDATIGGGRDNSASSNLATVGGGYHNGANGIAATIPGGYNNSAQGDYSFAAGERAKAKHQGAFVWGDSTNADINSPAANTFIVRANGGLWFGQATSDTTPTIGANVFINTSTGAKLTTGGVWTNASDRNQKENFSPVDGQEVLARLAKVPITTWNYKAEDRSVRHVGPAAQDFRAAFGVGEDDTNISTVDADGVALAAIQGLYQRIQKLESENAALKAETAAQETRLAALEAAVASGAGAAHPLQAGLLPGAGVLLAGLGLGVLARRREGR